MICSVSYRSYYSCHMGLQNCTMECMIEVGPGKWPEQKITNQNVAMVLKEDDRHDVGRVSSTCLHARFMRAHKPKCSVKYPTFGGYFRCSGNLETLETDTMVCARDDRGE